MSRSTPTSVLPSADTLLKRIVRLIRSIFSSNFSPLRPLQIPQLGQPIEISPYSPTVSIIGELLSFVKYRGKACNIFLAEVLTRIPDPRHRTPLLRTVLGNGLKIVIGRKCVNYVLRGGYGMRRLYGCMEREMYNMAYESIRFLSFTNVRLNWITNVKYDTSLTLVYEHRFRVGSSIAVRPRSLPFHRPSSPEFSKFDEVIRVGRNVPGRVYRNSLLSFEKDFGTLV